MAGFKINVNTQTLRDTAGEVEGINGELFEKLNDIHKRMDDLETSWESDGARTIREAMDKLSPRFKEYQEIVGDYVRFLRTTAEQYETTEEAVQLNANQFM